MFRGSEKNHCDSQTSLSNTYRLTDMGEFMYRQSSELKWWDIEPPLVTDRIVKAISSLTMPLGYHWIDEDERAAIFSYFPNFHRLFLPYNVSERHILHELGHAYLAETVHPLFSGMTVQAENRRAVRLIRHPLNLALDLYVERHVISGSSETERLVERENLAILLWKGYYSKDLRSTIQKLRASQTFALSIMEFDHPRRVPKKIEALVQASCDAYGPPSIRGVEHLTNEFLRLTGSDIRVRAGDGFWILRSET